MSEEYCPVCGINLAGIPTGFYAVDGRVMQRVCVPCIKAKQKGNVKLIVIGVTIGLLLGFLLLW